MSRPMIYRYIQQGLLEDRPVGTDHRVTARSVLDFAEERRLAGRQSAAMLEQTAIGRPLLQKLPRGAEWWVPWTSHDRGCALRRAG